MKNILNKLIICVCVSFILLSNFNFVFADTYYDDENINDNIDDDIETEDDPSYVDDTIDDLTDRINNIDSNITNIDTNINSLLNAPLLSSNFDPSNLSNGKNGFVLYLSPINVDAHSNYYLYYNNYDFIVFANGSNSKYHGFNIDDISSIVESDGVYTINTTGHTDFNLKFEPYMHSGAKSYILNPNNVSTIISDLGWFKLSPYDILNLDYALIPCKVLIDNLGTGDISNSAPVNDSNSSIYSKGQNITLTYDNSNHDFYCWYDFNTNQILSKFSTFNLTIEKDMNIKLINFDNADLIDDEDSEINMSIFYCLFVLILFLIFKSLIWGV